MHQCRQHLYHADDFFSAYAVAKIIGLPVPLLSSSVGVAYAPAMHAATEDSALMLRYKDGDVSAFEVLYRRHNDALYRYLLRLSQQQQTAEDLYQEVWSRIIRSKHRYRATAKFSTFLYRVAHNCFIDHLRRNKRHSHESAIDPEVMPDTADQPEVLAEKSMARLRLERALQILPDEQRDVFLLHEEAGLNLDTIAHVTGVSRETAKSRLRYAVRKLKAAMADPALNKGEAL
jgi:RNA polymerase sigma-70 factor, ECF subfamily